MRKQYYVFTRPSSDEAWAEMFYEQAGRKQHVTAPTPYFGPDAVERAEKRLQQLHPDAVVDQLLPEDVTDAMRFAR